MDAILLIFAIQLAVLLAFLALSFDFSKLGARQTARRVAQTFKALSSRPLTLCLKAFSCCEESLPESILETQAEESKDRPVDSRVILLESKQVPNGLIADDENAVKEDEVDALECEVDMKPNELFASELGPLRLFSRAFCWIFSIRATLFSNKRNYVATAKVSTCASKQISTISITKKRSYAACLASKTSSISASNFSSDRVMTYSLRYKNHQVPASVALMFRKKLVKLNFIIFKKKKTRPLNVIYEIPEEAY